MAFIELTLWLLSPRYLVTTMKRSRQIQRIRLVAEDRMELDDKRVDNAERGLRQIQVVNLKE